MTLRTATAAGAVGVAVAALAVAGSAGSARPDGFVAHRLVSDRADAQLVNAWGLAAAPGGVWWVTNEARESSTLYSGSGGKQLLRVAVSGGPTGIVYSGGDGFVVHGGGRAAPARFIFACEDGMISAWAPTVPRGWSRRAEVAVDSGASGAVFRGLARAGARLYVTDFHNDRVLVFDDHWRRVRRAHAFVDPAIPAWYAPFGITAAGDRVFVTYAYRAPVNGNAAPTGGYVDEFDLDGRLLARVGSKSRLDEPWGIAVAPPGFGRFGGDLLVANFGSGAINAYTRSGAGWTFRGRLRVKVPGVWGIAFGRGGAGGARTTLFYAAGPLRSAFNYPRGRWPGKVSASCSSTTRPRCARSAA
jgi:uncharacterized protein (TIGR03118 family)